MRAVETDDLVANYRIVRVLGQGGMGIVYEAEHSLIRSRVAIKMLRPALANDASIIGRLFEEARAAAAIDHPGIVQIHDFGRHPSGGVYLIMELLRGESLSARLARDGTPPSWVARAIVRQLAGALDACHRAGVVHRDLKPDNVFVIPDEDSRCGLRVKLLDFGVAKVAWGGSMRKQTQLGEMMGTPAYMSPEQCRGDAHIDARTDVYALGCLYYQLSCGAPPFAGRSFAETVLAHLHDDPVAPRAIDPMIPVDVEQLILGALSKDPTGRPQSMQEVRALLDAMT